MSNASQTIVVIPRGIRNNNPLNIRRGSDWLGLRPTQTDAAFCQFDNIIYGYRAALVILRRYIREYRCNTIRLIISRWAPASENNVAAYVRAVTTASGIPADQPISFQDESAVCSIVAAMQQHECGLPLGSAIVAATYRMFFSS